MNRTSRPSIGVDNAPINRPLTGGAQPEKWGGNRWATVGISIVILYTLVRNVLVAASRPFWFDELNTVIVAGQPTLGKVWYALRHAEDSAPLLYVLVEDLCGRLIPKAEIAYRVPSILACACILWCLFVFIRARSGPGIAFACAVLPLFTQIYWRYSVEARSYECVVACAAVALVCYQRADQKRWVIGLAVSLFAVGAFHYYGFFVLAPFLAAEFVQTIRIHAVRWGVWLAIFSGFLPVTAAYPILRQIKHFYGAHFWGQATWAIVWNMYGRTPFRASLIAMTAMVIMAVITIFVPVWRRPEVQSELFSANEHALAIVLIALPVLEYAGIKAAHGALTMRYALALILGVSIAVSYSLRFIGRWAILPAMFAMTALIVGQEAFLWKDRLPHPGEFVSPASSFEKLAARAGHTDLPIVVSDGEDYLPIAFYASPEWRGRVTALMDPTDEFAYVGSDSIDRQLSALRCCFALRADDFPVFASENQSFLLYSDGGDFDYWPRRLAAAKYDLQVLVADRNQKVYLAKRTTALP
jgi:hypothetical protein